MWQYIRQILQLVLSPTRGWEDISEASVPPDEIQRKGFYPWIDITALSEFAPLFYDSGRTVFMAFEMAIAVAGAMFAACFIARIVMGMTLGAHVDGTLNLTKVNTLALYMIGVAGLFQIIANIVPATLTVIHFLPLISLLIVFKAIPYMGVRQDNAMSFLLLAGIATIAIPMALTGLLSLIVM